MPAEITCGRAGGTLIGMEHCQNCYYKRLPDDVSTVFCKYRIKEMAKEVRMLMIKRQSCKTEDLKAIRDRQYAMGHPRAAEMTENKVKKSHERYKELGMINKAIAHITEQAMELAKQPGKRDAIIKIEEHLTATCIDTATAEKLLKKEKSLAELYNVIQKKAKEKATQKHGTTCVCLTSEDVFAMVDDYYNIAGAEKEKAGFVTEVNIFDLL